VTERALMTRLKRLRYGLLHVAGRPRPTAADDRSADATPAASLRPYRSREIGL
jgi:hypothetical protein